MAFSFKTIGQEIHVWYLLNRPPYDYDGPNKMFFDAIADGTGVELAEGFAFPVAKSETERYHGNSWVVFEYRGKHWRMDIDEYDSWEDGDEPTEPYEVSASPVTVIEYVRV